MNIPAAPSRARTGKRFLRIVILVGMLSSQLWGNGPYGFSSDADELVRLTDDGLFKQRPMWSPDGKQLVFARHRGATIFLFVRSADGREERRLTQGKDPEYDAAFSPDGSRLLFSYDKSSPNQGDIDIYAIPASNSEKMTPVVTTQQQLSHEEWPSWSPDGQWFAYTTTRYGNQELCVARADGKEETRLTNDPAIDAHPAWSPDGTRIAFATERWGDLEIAVVNRDGANLQRLTSSPGLDDYPAWDPAGKQLAFTSNRDGNQEIYVMNSDGQMQVRAHINPGVDSFPSFSPQGELTFVSQRNHGFDIYVLKRKNLPPASP